MDYEIRSHGKDSEVFLKGRLTFSDHEAFRNIVAIFKDGGASRCVLNLSGLDFIDSAGLGLLLIVRDSAQEKNVSVVLRGAGGAVKKMLDIAKFHEIIPLES